MVLFQSPRPSHPFIFQESEDMVDIVGTGTGFLNSGLTATIAQGSQKA